MMELLNPEQYSFNMIMQQLILAQNVKDSSLMVEVSWNGISNSHAPQLPNSHDLNINDLSFSVLCRLVIGIQSRKQGSM